MRVLVSGSTGTIGTALVEALQARGDEVVRLVRPETIGAEGIAWEPRSGELDPAAVAGFDAVVNLAGRSIGARRWSAGEKARLWESRIGPSGAIARAIATAVAAAEPRPATFVNASAVGYYGNRGDDIVDESDPPGSGFLSELTVAWEEATAPAADAGARVVLLRSGIVLSTRGGALGRMLAPLGPRWLSPYRWGVAGPIGRGRQWWSWVSLDDHVRSVVHLLTTSDLSGPVNVTSPSPVTNRDFTKALGRALGRPTAVPIPPFVVKIVLGTELATSLVLDGQRVVPRRLTEDGFRFHDTDLEAALREALAR